MKKWLVIFIISLYLLAPFAILKLPQTFQSISTILSLVSGCFLIAIAAFMQYKPSVEAEISMKSIMVLKLCLLPVYAVSFIAFLGCIFLVFTIWFSIPGLVVLPEVIAYSYFILYVSSSLTISRIIILGRKGTLTIGQCVVHIFLQLFFVADVVGSIVVYRKEHKSLLKSTYAQKMIESTTSYQAENQAES